MTRVAFLTTAVAVLAHAAVARAYDPATTHAGLTERAALASSLHRVLSRALSRPLGLFEPVGLSLDELPAKEAQALEARLAALDPSAGGSPGPDGVAPALSWIIAGSVIATTPAERGQDFFYDPSRGSGLSQAGGVASLGNTLGLLLDATSLRALFAGTSFNMTGRPSTEWLRAPENDVGLDAFHAGLEAAIAADRPQRRATALARAFLALGGVLTILEDAGEPAHVRNDYRRAYLGTRGPSPFDRGSAFEQFVADTYGRMGVPVAVTPVRRPTVTAFITAADGQGLADRTQRRFFSEGSLPEDPIVDRGTTAAEVMVDARGSLPYAYPRLPRLELKVMGRKQYAYTQGQSDGEGKGKGQGKDRRRLLAYERVPGRVRFFLDEAVYADTARVLLPEIAGYGAGLIDHLFRAEIKIETVVGAAEVSVTGAQGSLRKGEIRVFAEDASGVRQPIGTLQPGAAPGRIAVPAGTKRVAAVLRGEDDAGELVALGEAAVK
jgi:hypothetical protein